jgi:hypothetical protein
MAASCHRADVIQLLMQYGLKPDLTLYGGSPFQEAMQPFHYPLKGSGIDTMRLLLHDGEMMDNFEDETYILGSYPFLHNIDLETLEWLWMNASKALSTPELQGLRFCLIEILISGYESKSNTNDDVTECIIRLAPKGLIQRYQEEGKGLIGALFKFGTSSIESSQTGGGLHRPSEPLRSRRRIMYQHEGRVLPGAQLSMYQHEGRVLPGAQLSMARHAT